jgi:sigma-B regulation protein RsbU (phosphoserine phosphatase)
MSMDSASAILTSTDHVAERARTTPEGRHVMQCMEIWGGNEAFDNAVSMPGIDAWVYSHPHADDAAGGDVHYVSMCAGGKIARFALADVSGHGASVAELAVTLRSLMRRHINTVNQARFVQALNRTFMNLGATGRFATALLATYFAPREQLIVCNAGHPPGLWFRAADRRWRVLEDQVSERLGNAGNLPLGIIESTNFSQFAVQLGTGDLVLLYTDSLIEACDRYGRMLGVDGLVRMAQSLNAREPAMLVRQLIENVCAFRGGAPADDDVSVILLHHHGHGRQEFGLCERARTIGRMLGLLKV